MKQEQLQHRTLPAEVLGGLVVLITLIVLYFQVREGPRAVHAQTAQELDIVGSYELVSSTREILETGEIVNTFGDDPKGSIMYGVDGRMLVLLTRGDRIAPDSLAQMTDENRADLFRSMNAYGGTYTLDGDTIHHHIDISSNELWNGTTVTRHIRADGDYLIYTAEPAPFSGDGRMSVAILRWKKIE